MIVQVTVVVLVVCSLSYCIFRNNENTIENDRDIRRQKDYINGQVAAVHKRVDAVGVNIFESVLLEILEERYEKAIRKVIQVTLPKDTSFCIEARKMKNSKPSELVVTFFDSGISKYRRDGKEVPLEDVLAKYREIISIEEKCCPKKGKK